jgi:hypothetical protein
MEIENILVQDEQGTILGKFSFKNRDKAFELACQLEEMGIDARIVEPSLPESLISSLGASESDREILKKEIDEEISDHSDECCKP